MSTPTACQTLATKRADLKKQIAIRNATLIQGKHDPHPGKPDPEILGEKSAMVKELAGVQKNYETCMLANGPKRELKATFAGQVTLTIQDSNPAARGPFARSVSIGLLFDRWEDTLQVTSFPAITVGPFSVPGGSDTITITLTGATPAIGTFNAATGAFELSLALHFHHSNAFAGDSDITLHLSSKNAGGVPLDAAGNVVVAATSTFQGGFLGGDKTTAIVKGKISPWP
jgi:hypothetical protein